MKKKSVRPGDSTPPSPRIKTYLIGLLLLSIIVVFNQPRTVGLGTREQEVQDNHVRTKPKTWESMGGRCRHPRLNQFLHKGDMITPGNCTLGWDMPGTINSGQNLEDAVILARFFSGHSPMAHLSHGNGNGQAAGGIFLEMGGLDGVTFSNTRLYEYCAGWDGILIEAQPDNTKLLFENRPCAVVIPEGVCNVDDSSLDGYSTIRMSIGEGTSYDMTTRGEEGGDGVDVPCRPLSAMLDDYGVTRINFFSLDVEGAELKVLETFDFNKVKIDVLMVEAEFIETAGTHSDHSKIEAVRTLIETRSDLKRVPSRLDGDKTDIRLCERNGKKNDRQYCMFLSIAGSDVFVSPELYEYDTRPWEYTG